MRSSSLRNLLYRALGPARRGPRGRRPRTPAARRRACPLLVEPLEDRTLPSILAPLAGFSPTPITSDGTGGASQALTSYDGRYIVYSSTATNVVPGQVNTAVGSNIFLYDAVAGTTTLVSHVPGLATTTADGSSDTPRVSSDGSFVAFESTASDLVPDQAGPRGQDNVFLYDNRRFVSGFPNPNYGQVTLVSGTFDPVTGSPSPTVTGNDNSATSYTTGFGFGPGNDEYLLFSSFAGDLVANQDGPLVQDLFLYDTQLRTTTLVSHTWNSTASDQIGGDDDTAAADLTPDGRFVVYESFATNLIQGQNDEAEGNIFLYDAAADSTRLVSGAYDSSTGYPSPTKGAGHSLEPLISNGGFADGNLISFVSDAADLVAGQASTTRNVFVYDNRVAFGPGTTNYHFGQVSLVSGAGGSPSQGGNGNSPEAVLSGDGSTVAFISAATDLTGDTYPGPGPGDENGNVFLFDTFTLSDPTHSLPLASHAAASPTTAADGVFTNINDSFLDLSLSGDGTFVAYQSTADDLVTNQAPTTSDGSAVDNVFLYDWDLDQTTLVSRAYHSSASTGDDDSLFSYVSGDGSTVAFLSGADNVGANAQRGRLTLGNSGQNLFAFDVASAGDPTLVSARAFQAATTSLVWGTSGDGRFVIFTSDAPHVVPGQQDDNFAPDVFLLDRSTGQITLVSHVPGSTTQPGDGGSPDTVGGGLGTGPVISADGNWVAFVSDDSDLVPNEDTTAAGGNQIYLYDNRPGPTHGTITLVSHDSGTATLAGDDNADTPVVTDDPTGSIAYVAYVSYSDDLVPFYQDPLGLATNNVYLYNSATGNNTLVSGEFDNPATPNDTKPQLGGDQVSFSPTLSDGGRYIAYASRASNLVTATTFSVDNVYLYDRTTGKNTLVTRSNSSATSGADDSSLAPVISADGSTVAFTSFADDLAPNQTPLSNTDFTNVYLYSVAGQSIRLVSGFDGSGVDGADGYSDSPVLSSDGSRVAFRSDAPDLLAGDPFPVGSNGLSNSNVFLFDAGTGSVTLVSHNVNNARVPAAGDSEAPAIDGAGDLVVYLSRATDLVPGQQEPAAIVNNVFVYSTTINGGAGANGLASGPGGSITMPSSAPAFQALISRDPVIAFNLLAQNNTSVAQLNSLAELRLAPNTVTDGSPPGTVVGTLSIFSVFAGQYLLPRYQPLPAGSGFALGGTTGNAIPLVTEFAANAAARSVYQVLPVVNIGFGFTPAALTVFIGAHPVVPPPDPLLPELVPVRVGRHRTVRLMVEVFDLVTGVEVMALLCPFQAPTYHAITVIPLSNGLFLLSARRGKHTVMALLVE